MGDFASIRTEASRLEVSRTEDAAELNRPTEQQLTSLRAAMTASGGSERVIIDFFDSIAANAAAVLSSAEVNTFSSSTAFSNPRGFAASSGLRVNVHGFEFSGGYYCPSGIEGTEADLIDLCRVATSLGLSLNGEVVQRGFSRLSDNAHYCVRENAVSVKRAVGFLFDDASTEQF